MLLLTARDVARLQANGRRQKPRKGAPGELDFVPATKLFQPDGVATWLLTEIDPDDPDQAFGLCDLGHGQPELGYVRLHGDVLGLPRSTNPDGRVTETRPPGLSIRGLRSELAGPFDLHLTPGAALSIAGASGAGESLFLRMLADLDLNTGEVTLVVVSRANLPGPEWRRQVSYVAAESGWWRDKVFEHVAPVHRAAALTLAMRLGSGRDQFQGPVARLSTGERQRLALVRALVRDAPVLLLDEPTGPLDPVSVTKVEDILAERLSQGAVLFIVSHDPKQGERLRARRYRMVERRLEVLA